MNKLRSVIIFIGAFVVAGAVVAAFLRQSGMFLVSDVPIEVSSVAQSSSVTSGPAGLRARLMPKTKALIGKKIWAVNLKSLRASIAQDEWVKGVFIARSFPNGVTVKVEPKQTISVLVGSRGSLWPVTEDASILTKLSSDALPDVPLLRGEIFLNDKARLQNVVGLVKQLPSSGPLSRQNISEITWTKDSGYSFMLMHPRIEIKFGDEKVDLKIQRVAQVVNYLNTQGVEGKMIDASFSKKVLVRVRKGP